MKASMRWWSNQLELLKTNQIQNHEEMYCNRGHGLYGGTESNIKDFLNVKYTSEKEKSGVIVFQPVEANLIFALQKGSLYTPLKFKVHYLAPSERAVHAVAERQVKIEDVINALLEALNFYMNKTNDEGWLEQTPHIQARAYQISHENQKTRYNISINTLPLQTIFCQQKDIDGQTLRYTSKD